MAVFPHLIASTLQTDTDINIDTGTKTDTDTDADTDTDTDTQHYMRRLVKQHTQLFAKQHMLLLRACFFADSRFNISAKFGLLRDSSYRFLPASGLSGPLIRACGRRRAVSALPAPAIAGDSAPLLPRLLSCSFRLELGATH